MHIFGIFCFSASCFSSLVWLHYCFACHHFVLFTLAIVLNNNTNNTADRHAAALQACCVRPNEIGGSRNAYRIASGFCLGAHPMTGDSYAMMPASAVSALVFGHQDSKYFAVGAVNKDQISSYAERKGDTLETIERWLAPILNKSRRGSRRPFNSPLRHDRIKRKPCKYQI